METFALPVYQISPDDTEKLCISALLNEAEHVFRFHTDGAWKSTHKEQYARLLAPHLRLHPKLIRNINSLKDVLHNPREDVIVRIGMGRKASFCS